MILCMAIICGFFMLSSAYAKVIYVKKGASGDGSSWTQAFGDLQDAIDAATTGDEIWVCKQTYQPKAVTGDQRNRTFTLKSGVSIYGGFIGNETYRHERDWKANETILTGYIDATTRCFHVVYAANATADSDYYFDGFTIAYGKAEDDTDFNNTNNYGGAIYYGASRYKIVNCKFFNNSAFRGGAIGVKLATSISKITNCTFISNRSTGDSGTGGGAIIIDRGNLTIDRCLFENNSSTKVSGAIYPMGAILTITNTTIFNNYATNYGGAIYADEANTQGVITITNCTITKNTGELGIGGLLGNGVDINLKNSIVWHNYKSGNVEEDILTLGGTQSSSYNIIKAISTDPSNTFTADATDVTGAASEALALDNDTQPNGAVWAPETIALLAGDTVAIDTGTTDSPITDIDQRSTGRDNSPDRGAFEYNPKPAVFTHPSSENWCEEAEVVGQVLSEGGSTVSARGIDWGTAPGALTNTETYSGGAAITDPFIITVSGLDIGTTYYYQAWAINDTGTTRGDIVSFITKLCGDVDGNGSVQIADAIAVLQIISKINPGFAANMDADVNRDGKISYEEALYILRKVAGL